MANSLISIRISEELLNDASKITKLEGFTSLQEYIRQALRESVKKHKLQQSILALQKLEGSQPVKRASKEALEKHIKKLFG